MHIYVCTDTHTYIMYTHIYIYGCESKCKAPIHTLNPQADPYPRSIPKRRWSRPIHTSGSPRADPYPNFDATPYIYIIYIYIFIILSVCVIYAHTLHTDTHTLYIYIYIIYNIYIYTYSVIVCGNAPLEARTWDSRFFLQMACCGYESNYVKPLSTSTRHGWCG